jgi:hypothetical protein
MLYEYACPLAAIGLILLAFTIAYRWLDKSIAEDSAQWQRNQRGAQTDEEDEGYP